MNFFTKLFRSRDKPQNHLGGLSFLFGQTTAGKAVNERTAMQTTAVYACVRILAESIAGLPLHVYAYQGQGKERVPEHPLYFLLHDAPNPEMTSFVFRETLMDQILTIRLYAAGIGIVVGEFLGSFDDLLYALVAFVATDYVTGVFRAIVEKKLSSAIGFKGICKKVCIFILVGVANVLDVHIIGSGCVLRSAVIFFYISNEGISIIENAARMGLPVPQKLQDMMHSLRDK